MNYELICLESAVVRDDVESVKRIFLLEKHEHILRDLLDIAAKNHCYDTLVHLMQFLSAHELTQQLVVFALGAYRYGDIRMIETLHQFDSSILQQTIETRFNIVVGCAYSALAIKPIFWFINNFDNAALALVFRLCDVNPNQWMGLGRFETDKTALTFSAEIQNYFAFDLLLRNGADPLVYPGNCTQNTFDWVCHIEDTAMLYKLIANSNGAWKMYQPLQRERKDEGEVNSVDHEPRDLARERFFKKVLCLWQKHRLIALAVGLAPQQLSVLCLVEIAAQHIGDGTRGLTNAQIFDTLAKICGLLR